MLAMLYQRTHNATALSTGVKPVTAGTEIAPKGIWYVRQSEMT